MSKYCSQVDIRFPIHKRPDPVPPTCSCKEPLPGLDALQASLSADPVCPSGTYTLSRTGPLLTSD